MLRGCIYRLIFLASMVIAIFSCSPNTGLMPDFEIKSDQKDIFTGQEVEFNLSPEATDISCVWHFSGGIPAQSGDLQPTVEYPEPGSYSVWVEIHRDEYVITKKCENYIHVELDPQALFCFYGLKADKTTMKESDHVYLEAKVQGENVNYEWSAGTGTVKGEGPKADFYFCRKFEHYLGDVKITCKAWNDHGSKEREVVIHVID